MPMPISIVVEGAIDEAVAKRLIGHLGAETGPVYIKRGRDPIEKKIQGYNNAARFTPWIVLVDLDSKTACAPELRPAWLPSPSPHLCFRIAVRTVEAWLMADRQRLAKCLRVSEALVPREPEREMHPKARMVDLARQSRSSSIRMDLVPRPGSERATGSAYISRPIEFVMQDWRPAVAAGNSDSLRRSIQCLERLIAADIRP